MIRLFRLYEPHEIGRDGYPHVWHTGVEEMAAGGKSVTVGVKDLVRADAGHRCVRCGHPYIVGESGHFEDTTIDLALQGEDGRLFYADMGDVSPPAGIRNRAVNWSPCDERCRHAGPIRYGDNPPFDDGSAHEFVTRCARDGLPNGTVQAAWRILTVHHLNQRKHDLRWFNLAALCQRDHLVIQRKVRMDNPWPYDHTSWFQPHAAAFYAYKYLGEELTREETMARLDELLALGKHEEAIERMPL